MPDFTIDRATLPKPWTNPLIFVLRNDDLTIEAEVEQSAAIEYQSAWRAGGIALALAHQRTEDFVVSVEAAVERLFGAEAKTKSGTVLLSWDDINP